MKFNSFLKSYAELPAHTQIILAVTTLALTVIILAVLLVIGFNAEIGSVIIGFLAGIYGLVTANRSLKRTKTGKGNRQQ